MQHIICYIFAYMLLRYAAYYMTIFLLQIYMLHKICKKVTSIYAL